MVMAIGSAGEIPRLAGDRAAHLHEPVQAARTRRGLRVLRSTLAGYLLTIDEARRQPICTAAKRVKATIFINGNLGGALCAGTLETPVICGLNGSEGVIGRTFPRT